MTQAENSLADSSRKQSCGYQYCMSKLSKSSSAKVTYCRLCLEKSNEAALALPKLIVGFNRARPVKLLAVNAKMMMIMSGCD